MKRFFLVTVLAGWTGLQAQAEVFKCNFTEPFMNLKYDTATEVVTVRAEFDNNKERMTKNVKFRIKDAGFYTLSNSQGELMAEIKMTRNASDGMSDSVYPFEIRLLTYGAHSSSGLFGGCSSSGLSAK